jgi:hypothetical protein
MNWAKATNFLGHAENMLAKMDGSVGGLLGGDSESEEEGTASSHSCRPSHPPRSPEDDDLSLHTYVSRNATAGADIAASTALKSDQELLASLEAGIVHTVCSSAPRLGITHLGITPTHLPASAEVALEVPASAAPASKPAAAAEEYAWSDDEDDDTKPKSPPAKQSTAATAATTSAASTPAAPAAPASTPLGKLADGGAVAQLVERNQQLSALVRRQEEELDAFDKRMLVAQAQLHESKELGARTQKVAREKIKEQSEALARAEKGAAKAERERADEQGGADGRLEKLQREVEAADEERDIYKEEAEEARARMEQALAEKDSALQAGKCHSQWCGPVVWPGGVAWW